jgi:hypothetical protein
MQIAILSSNKSNKSDTFFIIFSVTFFWPCNSPVALCKINFLPDDDAGMRIIVFIIGQRPLSDPGAACAEQGVRGDIAL